jgi:hypothetical protein
METHNLANPVIRSLLLLWLAGPTTGLGATITIVNSDGAGEGFNDPTPAPHCLGIPAPPGARNA